MTEQLKRIIEGQMAKNCFKIVTCLTEKFSSFSTGTNRQSAGKENQEISAHA